MRNIAATLFSLLFALPAIAQQTSLATPVEVGPITVKLDTTSISSIDWANAGQGITFAHQQQIPKVGGGFEVFYQRAYPHGLSLEYAGLVEWMVEGFSIRHNFRYTHLLPKTYGNGAYFYVGDRLDTGGLQVQPVGTLRVDENNDYEIEPETGQPYLDDKAIEFTARTWRGENEGGLDAGDMRFIVRGATRKFEFKGGPKSAEQVYAVIGPAGLIVGGVNYTTLIAALEQRINDLEARVTALEGPLE